MAEPSWEESWPEAEDALKQAAREHAAMISKERQKTMTANRKARASEKALRALPAAMQRAETAEAAVTSAAVVRSQGCRPAAVCRRGIAVRRPGERRRTDS